MENEIDEETLGIIQQALTTEAIEKNMKAKKERKQAEWALLQAQAKPREELITPLEFLVLESTTTTSHHLITPSSEIRFGERTPVYDVGSSSYLELKVQGDNPITSLTYAGIAHLEAGDSIRAYILKGTEVTEDEGDEFDFPNWARDDDMYTHSKSSIWIPRDYKETEPTSKIEKLRDGKVVATYQIK